MRLIRLNLQVYLVLCLAALWLYEVHRYSVFRFTRWAWNRRVVWYCTRPYAHSLRVTSALCQLLVPKDWPL